MKAISGFLTMGLERREREREKYPVLPLQQSGLVCKKPMTPFYTRVDVTWTAARLSTCTQLQEHVCPVSEAGHEIVCCCVNGVRWKQTITLYLCALGIAGDRGKYNLNVQQQHPKCSYSGKLSPSCACITT